MNYQSRKPEIFQQEHPQAFIYHEDFQSFDSLDSCISGTHKIEMNEEEQNAHNVEPISKPIYAKRVSPSKKKRLSKNINIEGAKSFFYKGSEAGFKAKLNQLPDPQLETISEVYVSISGNKITPGNEICLIITIVLSTLFIVPIFIMCFDSWKRLVYPCFEISIDFYRSLGRLCHKDLESLTLLVNDNNFGKEKAFVIHESLKSLPKIIGFTFINFAEPINYHEKEYSNFGENMIKTKKLGMIVDLRWFRQTVKDE